MPRGRGYHQSTDNAAVETSTSAGATINALCNATAYALTYFWRYPVFMLPSKILDAEVATVFGTALDLRVSFSIAFTLGFGLAKLPSLALVTSPFFFAIRLQVLLVVLIGSAAIEGGGVWAFEGTPSLQVACVFLSSLLSSCIYGALITYVEGRETTEVVLALITGLHVYAGTLSRAAAALVLRWGALPDSAMPLALAAVACPLSCALLVVVDRAPGPSPADVAARTIRAPMTSPERSAFLRAYLPGVLAVVPAYALLAGVRSFRDLYAGPIVSAALGVADTKDIPPYFFFVADLPGAVAVVGGLVLLGTVTDHRACLRWMLGAMVCGAVSTVGVTVLFEVDLLGGLAWQLLLGCTVFTTYTFLGAPFFERLFAATRTRGTVSFLIFGADMFGCEHHVSN